MKRILVLSLALILAVGSLAVPANAVEPMTEINFLSAMEYDIFRNDVLWQSVVVPSSYSNGYTSFMYQWDFIHPLSFDRVVFIIDVAEQPDKVILHRGDWEHEASLIASNGTKYQYEVVLSGTARSFRSTAAIEIQNNSDYFGVFNIISCVGYVSNTVSFSHVNYFANALLYDNGDGGMSPPDPDDFRWPVSVGSGNNVSLPVVVDFDGPTGSDFYSLDYGEVFLKVPFDSSLQYLNSVSFLIYTCGEIDTLGARLENANGSVLGGISATLEYCGETQYVFDLEEQFERILCYVVTVDISGYDLSDLFLTLQVNIKSVFGSFMYQYDRGFYFQCDSIYGTYDSFEAPWYSIFGRWLNTQLAFFNSNIISSISNFQSSVTSTLTGFQTSVISGISNFQSSVNSWLSDIYNVLVPENNSDDFKDQVDDQGDRLDQMDEALNSVTKPALDRVDTNISGIVSDTDLSNTAHVYTYIIDDNIMAPALTMVTILAMMSFALFGKR